MLARLTLISACCFLGACDLNQISESDARSGVDKIVAGVDGSIRAFGFKVEQGSVQSFSKLDKGYEAVSVHRLDVDQNGAITAEESVLLRHVVSGSRVSPVVVTALADSQIRSSLMAFTGQQEPFSMTVRGKLGTANDGELTLAGIQVDEPSGQLKLNPGVVRFKRGSGDKMLFTFEHGGGMMTTPTFQTELGAIDIKVAAENPDFNKLYAATGNGTVGPFALSMQGATLRIGKTTFDTAQSITGTRYSDSSMNLKATQIRLVSPGKPEKSFGDVEIAMQTQNLPMQAILDIGQVGVTQPEAILIGDLRALPAPMSLGFKIRQAPEIDLSVGVSVPQMPAHVAALEQMPAWALSAAKIQLKGELSGDPARTAQAFAIAYGAEQMVEPRENGVGFDLSLEGGQIRNGQGATIAPSFMGGNSLIE